ncbi:ATP-binding protein [Pseudomonas syringae]|uniref:ATP-binding protein n=1 Tax=Pseudomonas syringae TaxID=317 RepID=UPI00200A010F|nr:ATP-binding protein [Pseudomonas syringae]MCK9743910.1 AAA family ATPase [Pseudomonas syringae pv. syringae]MCK9768905.1 AAA family ATPase [Pseudomonas syringae pv. syringae]
MDAQESSLNQHALILLSGPIAAGKSTISKMLISKFGFKGLSSGDYLRALLDSANLPKTRERLQELGDRLDLETNYEWLAEKVTTEAVAHESQKKWIIDSVRKPQQITSHRKLFGKAVIHVHIIASPNILKDRYLARTNSTEIEYLAAKMHPNEISSEELDKNANLTFDTSLMSTEDICDTIAKHAGIDV